MNSINRMFKVLFSPSEVFEEVAKAPNLVVPILMIIVLTAGYLSYFAYNADFPVIVEKQLELNSKTREMSDAQKENIIKAQSKFAKPAMMIAPPVMVIIMLLIFGLYFFVVSKIAGSDISFVQSMAIPTYGWAVVIPTFVVMMLIMILTDASTTPIESLSPSGLAYFLDPEAVGTKLYKLSMSLDIFKFWSYVLMIIGFHKIAKVKMLTAVLTIMIPWALFVGIGVLLS